MSNLKVLVLNSFKKLHRTRMKVFAGDETALNAARIRINEEYKKNKNVQNEDSIKTLVKFGEDVEKELRTIVIQAREIKPGLYEARIREDIDKLDNIPFMKDAVPKEGIKKKNFSCCNNQSQIK